MSEDVVVRDVAGGSFNTNAVRAELNYERRRRVARGSGAGEENEIPCATPRHPAGDAATNTSKTSDDQVGCVSIKRIYRLRVQQCLAVLATWVYRLCVGQPTFTGASVWKSTTIFPMCFPLCMSRSADSISDTGKICSGNAT